jgi:hypothetical protein
MKLKTIDIEGKTYAMLEDGKPIYEHSDGKSIPFDAPGTVATISRLNGEAKGHRERAEEALKTLKAFEGIEDAAAAKKALETVKNLDAKKLVDAGEVEKVRAEAIKAVEEKYAPVIGERDTLKAALVQEKVGGAFSRSKLIAEKLAIPPDMVEARFGSAFKVEGSDVVAYDAGGNKLFSRAKPGEVAGFDEALEILIDQYPYKDHILKSSGASGSGAQGAGNANGGGKTMTRAAFDQLSPEAKFTTARSGTVITD